MKLSRLLSILLLTMGLSYGSSLAVYQDKTIYTFTPQDKYIGFTKGIKAKCEGSSIALEVRYACPSDKRLCKDLLSLKNTEQELYGIEANIKVLDQLISLPRPTSFDASAWIESARLIGTQQANLSAQKQKAFQELFLKQKAFQKQSITKDALFSTEICQKELELSIPYGYLSFFIKYEANIINEKEISVRQNISIINRSGIDIQVDTAAFYYRLANQYINPIYFNPWILSKDASKAKNAYKKSMMKEISIDTAMTTQDMVMSAPMATYEDTREYKVQNLILPSTGVPIDVEVLTWTAPLSCEIRAYPYASTKAFHLCSFKPKYQIEGNKWSVKYEKVMINENAVGEYRDEKYNLYTKVEEDIQIERKPIVQKERETGIFGATAHIKDGYTLTLTNKSNKSKALTLVERIPTSTSQKIKAKLLSIKSNKEVKYEILKDGQIEMKINLAANESKKIEVLFEISYDKDLKISY